MVHVPSESEANEKFRRSMDKGKVVLIGKIVARPDLGEILRRIRRDAYDSNVDIFKMRAFGTVEHRKELFCWEISTQLSLEDVGFSRVITVMHAEDY